VALTPDPLISTAVDTVFLSAIANSRATPGDTISISNGGGGSLAGLAVGTISCGRGPANWLTAWTQGNTVGGNSPTASGHPTTEPDHPRPSPRRGGGVAPTPQHRWALTNPPGIPKLRLAATAPTLP